MLAIPKYAYIDIALSAAFLFCILFMLGKPLRQRTKKPSGRIGFVDFARGLAIVTIVAVHAANMVWEAKGLNPFIGFGVEIFVLTSGYLLARRYSESLELRNYFGKIFFRVALVYALFVVAIYLLSNSLSVSLPNLALDFLLGRQNGNGYYFIPVILQLYLVFPLLRRVGSDRKSIAALFVLLAATIIWGSIDSQLRKPDWNSDPLILAFAGRYAFLFAFGIFLANYEFEKLPLAVSAMVAASYLALAGFTSYTDNSLFLGYLYPVFFLFVFNAAYAAFSKAPFASQIRLLLEPLGKQSLLIYLFHAILLYGVVAHIVPVMTWQLRYAILIVLTAALSFACSEIFMLAYKRLTGFKTL